MYYSNNILMPFKITDQFPEEINKPITDYYNSLGYNVIKRGVIDEENGNFLRSSSRNLLPEATDDDFLVIIDADTIVSDAAIQQAKKICEKNNVVVRLASKTYTIDLNNQKFIENILKDEVIENQSLDILNAKYLHAGCSWAMNRKTWEYLGGFNESFRWYGYEDLEFNLRASRLLKLVFLNYDEYAIKNKKLINFDLNVNEHIYNTSFEIFFNPNKINMSIMMGDVELDIEKDLNEKNMIIDIFKYNNYGIAKV